MSREIKAAIKVRFINSNGILSDKKYTYWIDEKINNKLKKYDDGFGFPKEVDSNKTVYDSYYIENENGYTYRKQRVIIVDVAYANVTIEAIKRESEATNRPIMFLNNVTIAEPYSYKTTKIKDDKNVEIEKAREVERNEEGMFENLMKNVKIGKVKNLEMSMYGPAFNSSEGKMISYNSKNNEWVDVTGLTFDFSMAYMMPVSVEEIKPNDFILHNGLWVRVVEIKETIMVEKIFEKEVTFILPTKNLFGFNFVTKLIYFSFENLANEKNPFGNLLPLIAMEDSDMLPLMMMTQDKGEGSAFTLDFNNPLMMYMMMKDSDFDMLPLMMMMNMKNSAT